MNISTIKVGSWIGFLGKGLAPRELEATAYAADDLTMKEIARAMGISPRTVEKRLDDARFKLGAKTMRGLVMAALRLGIIAVASQSVSPPPYQQEQESTDGTFIA
jgi:DNA-binding CsgD family transcriptional regulator